MLPNASSLFVNKWYKKKSNRVFFFNTSVEAETYILVLFRLVMHSRKERSSKILYTTVDLLRDIRSREGAPVPAGLRDLLRDWQLLDLVWLDEELQEEAGGRMPSDVATVVSSARGSLRNMGLLIGGGYSLEWPNSRMVRIELNDDVPVGPHLLDVTSLRVVGVHDDAVPGPWALGQDVHVEAVKVDRVAVEWC